MRQASAVAMSPAEAEGWLKIAGSVLAIGGAAGAAVVKLWREFKRRRDHKELERRAIRYELDALHHILDAIVPSPDGRLTDLAELQRQLSLISDLRREVWRADGHELPEDEPAAIVKKWLTRTQRVEALKARRAEERGPGA